MGQHYLDPVQYILDKDDTSPVEIEATAPWPQHPDAVGLWGQVYMKYADGCKIILESCEWGEEETKGKPFIEGPLGKVYRNFRTEPECLATLVAEEIPVKMVILDNRHLGMVAQWEDRFFGSNRGNTMLGRCKGGRRSDDDAGFYPDFVRIAAGYDIPGRHVFTRGELAPAIREMLDAPGSFLLHVHISFADHVLPMIPPGSDYRHTLLE